MQHYTSIEQSKKLLELGLNLDTADMHYSMLYHRAIDGGGKNLSDFLAILKPIGTEDIPCWSLGALLKLIEGIIIEDEGLLSFTLRNHYNGWSIQCELLDYNTSCSTPLEAAYNMIVWLIENGYIKKGE